MKDSLPIFLAQASSRQDEVFRSIQNSMGAPTDITPLIIFMGVMILAVIAIAIIQHRRRNPNTGDSLLSRTPKPIYSHSRLTRELTANSIVSSETLARASTRARAVGAQSPITVLLLGSLSSQPPAAPRKDPADTLE